MTKRIAAFALTMFVFALWGCAGGGSGGGGGSTGGTTVGPATQLAMITQPAGATTGNAFATQPVVEIRDAAGLRVTTDNTTAISVAITGGTGTGGAILSGNLSVIATSGRVSFSGLSIDL
ncbi:MAG: hypothetical protein KDB90_12045, partial [Planctomycetes bacterium]|nr:hypothetical protein [Planctomycetota bacterium]